MHLDLRVPVRRIAAQLVLDGGSTREATLFLADGESMGDLLGRAEAFLPVEEGGRMRFYARRAVACITVPASPASADDELGLARRAVIARLRGGGERAGQLRFAASPGGRTLEVLNQAAASLVLHDGDRVHYVATAHVERVEEV